VSRTEAVSVPQAARRLGISERAVRKQIQTGKLRAERDGRRWIVYLESETESGTSTADSGTAEVPLGTSSDSRLIEHLQRENARLWEELEARREAERELRIIIARLSERPAAIEAQTLEPESEPVPPWYRRLWKWLP
jgi:excisionase family DNA binding protein